MSNVLDDNVVILRFDNSDFEKNTKQSMDTLDKLKNSVDSTGGESLKNLGKAANSVNLSGLSKSIDTINSRFSTMGVIGASAINKLTSSAMSSVKNIVTAIPNQMIQGGWKRALNIEQAEYLMKGLGVAFEGTFDKVTGKIEGVKGAVLASVNDTRYGLDEAAKAASTLIASDERLKNNAELLADRLKAISGVAAVTSSEYESISYIFTKVAGQGRMMTNELNMLSMKGFNAAVEIQKYLNANGDIKNQALENAIALGHQSKKMEEIRTHAELTEADVREMVSAGAIDFDIMSNSLLHFFDTAAGANETFEGSLANVKAAFSRMGAQVEAVKLQNLTKIFNYLLPVLKRFEDFIEPFTSKINKFSTKFTDFLGEGIINPLGKAIGTDSKNLFHGFEKAVEDTAKGVTKANEEIQQSTDKTDKEILNLNKEYQAARDIWYKGSYGSGSKRKNAIEQIGASYKKTQSIINQFYKDGFKWDNIEKQLIKDYKSKNETLDESTESTQQATEATEKQVKKYPTMVALVKSFVNLTASAGLTLGGIKNILVIIGSVFKKLISPGLKTGANGFEKITEKILAASKKFNEFTKTFKTDFSSDEWRKKHAIISSLFDALSSGFSYAKKVVSDSILTIKEFFAQLSESEGINALKTELQDLYDVIKSLAEGALKDLADTFNGLSDQSTASSMETSVSNISKFANVLAEGVKSVKDGIKPLDLFSKTLDNVKKSASFESNGSFIIGSGANAISGKSSIVSAVSNASEMLKKANVSKNFSSATESVTNFMDGVQKASGKVDYKGSFDTIIDSFKNADWNNLSKIALRVGSLYAILRTVKDMGTLVNATAGTLGSISGFFKSLSGVAMAYKKTLNVKMFETISISIGILVGSIVALAAIPTDRLYPALGGVVAILAMVVTVITMMNSPKFDPKKLAATGIAFASIGASLLLVAMACKLLASINAASLFKAGVAITSFIGIFVLASALRGRISGSALSFIAMATSINILITAIGVLAVMPWSVILKGMSAVALIMAELVIASRLAQYARPVGLVAMAASLDLLLPAIFVLSMMPVDKALKGAVVASAVIAMLGVASKVASGTARTMTSMVVMTSTVSSLTAALVVLSFIDPKRLAVAAAALTATMVSLGMAGKVASTAKAGMALMALVIAMLGATILSLMRLDADKAIEVTTSLAVFASSLAVAMGLFSVIGIKGALVGIAGLGIAIAGISAIVAGLGFLNKSEGLKKKIKQGGEFLKVLGESLGKFVAGLGVGVTSGLPEMGENISSFMESIQPFIEAASKVKPEAAKGAKDLVTAILNLTKAEFLDSFSAFTGKGSMDDFADQLVGLADAFIKFSDKVKSIPDDVVEKTKTVSSALKSLTRMVENIPRSGGIEQIFTGVIDTKAFAKGISNISEVCVELSDLDLDSLKEAKENIEPVADIVRIMARAASKIPESRGAKQVLLGNTTISEFAIFLKDFIPDFSAFVAATSGLVITDDVGNTINKIADIIITMSKAANKIPESFGAKQILTGNTTINEFARQLTLAIPGIFEFISVASEYATSLGSDGIKLVKQVVSAIRAMAEASQEIPETGGLKQIAYGGKDISNFAMDLSAAIPGLQVFFAGASEMEIGKADVTKAKRIAIAVKAMAEVADALPSSGGIKKLSGEKDIGTFGKQLGKLLSSLSNVGDFNIEPSKFSNAAEALNTITPAIQTFKGAMPIPTGKNLVSLGQSVVSFTESMGGASTKGIGSKASSVTAAVKKLGTAASAGAKSLGNTKGFSSAGSSLGSDFVKGINKYKSSAKTAGAALAKQAKSGAGSVSLYGTGKDVGQGFVNGINAKKQAAYNSGKALGYQAKKGAKNAVDSDSPAKEFIKIGGFIGEGLVIGMKSYERKVYKQGESVGLMSIDGTNSGIEEAVNGLMDPVITPVVDLSNFNRDISTMDNAFSRNRALGINSTFEASDYRNSQMMNSMVDTLNKMSNTKQPSNNYFTFNVDGAENPEQFAQRFMRQVQLEMRTG